MFLDVRETRFRVLLPGWPRVSGRAKAFGGATRSASGEAKLSSFGWVYSRAGGWVFFFWGGVWGCSFESIYISIIYIDMWLG